MGRIIPYIMENKKRLKPPTRYGFLWIYYGFMVDLWLIYMDLYSWIYMDLC
jgi:hypothetical protein